MSEDYHVTSRNVAEALDDALIDQAEVMPREVVIRAVEMLEERIRLLEQACERAAFFIRHYGDMSSLDEQEVLGLLESAPAPDGEQQARRP